MKKLISILAVFSMLFCCSAMSCSFAAETAKKENPFTMGAKSQTENKKAIDASKKIKGASIAAIAALGTVGTSIAAKNSYAEGFKEGSQYDAKDIATNVIEGIGLAALLAGTAFGLWEAGVGAYYGSIAIYGGVSNFLNSSFGQAADAGRFANAWHNTQYAFSYLFSKNTRLFSALKSLIGQNGITKANVIAVVGAVAREANLGNRAASDGVIDAIAGGGQPLNGLAPAGVAALKNAVATFFNLK